MRMLDISPYYLENMVLTMGSTLFIPIKVSLLSVKTITGVTLLPLKEGNLPTIWEETRELQNYQIENWHQELIIRPDENTEERSYRWVTKMDYHGHTLNWLGN